MGLLFLHSWNSLTSLLYAVGSFCFISDLKVATLMAKALCLASSFPASALGTSGDSSPQVFPPPPYLSGTSFWLVLSVHLQVSLPQPFSQYFPLTNYLSIPLYICPLLTLSNGPPM